MSTVELRQVSKRYGATNVVEPLDLTVREGEFLTLLGPSGCGKTTTLRMIAGLVDPTAGTLLIGGEDVTHTPPQKRDVGMVFQDYSLFPHLTVADNIAFGLVERRVPRAERTARVRELLDLIRLPGIEGRYPAELSGGQQQRVALARAVAYPPRVLLMDEPLGALDLKLREAMQEELRRIQQTLKLTTVFVTHDQTEAMNLSDRIAVMNQGRIEQLDVPEAIYRRPRTRFVAAFVGSINLIDGALDGDGRTFVVGPVRIPVDMPVPATHGGKVTLGLRPEHLRVIPPGRDAPGLHTVPARVVGQTFLGSVVHIDAVLDGGTPLLIEARPDDVSVRLDERITIGWPPQRATLLTD